ncbi:MAG: arginine--tRNA ligase [Candidatus Pacearchaeota archaeon]
MKDRVIEFISKSINYPKEEIKNFIEIPPQEIFGDYSMPCFFLSKIYSKPPVEVAYELMRTLSSKLPKEIIRVEQKGPYINFFIDKKLLAKEVLSKSVLDEYGISHEKEKIVLEHTSVNPNASPHVGRARNSIIGDSIARILKFRGNKVETHYYVNDVSKQVAILALEFDENSSFEDMLDRYVSASEKVSKSPALEKKVFELLEKFESGDKEVKKKFQKIVSICVEGQKKIFEKFDIKFDYFDFESKYIGKLSNLVLDKLKKTGKVFQDEEGRLVLNQSGTPVAQKMKSPYFVLTRSNGTGLYGLRDLAYTIEKSKKGKNIIVLGEDQKLYFEQISEALKLLKVPIPIVVHYSYVLISTSEGAKKMSTRKGELVLLEDFFNEAFSRAKKEVEKRNSKGDPKKIAIAAIKYSMLRNDNDKNIIFDWNHSLNFEGDSGPYLQYSYARASSILRKFNGKFSKFIIPELSSSEIHLIKQLSLFPEVVEKASKSFSPSIIANYSFQLAKSFNEFYHSCPVINDINEQFRLRLVMAFRKTIKKCLFLLGIEVMEEM